MVARQEKLLLDLLRLHVQLPAILEAVSDAVLLVDLQTEEVIEANEAACEVFARPAKHLIGHSIFELPLEAPIGPIMERVLEVECDGPEPVRVLGPAGGRPLEAFACRLDRSGRPLVFFALREPTAERDTPWAGRSPARVCP